MNDKISWQEIYKDFKNRHPNLSKGVARWLPRDYLAIEIYLNDGMEIEYDYFTHTAKIIQDCE